MYSRFFLSLSAVALLPCSVALAQDTGASEPEMLETVTVTASRAARPIEELPQTIQVIDRVSIEEQLRQGNNAGALLSRKVPGYSVSNQTVSSASETFRGRDLLVMIDGVPLNTPLRDVSRILSLIDLNTIDRIELLAGASSINGSSATGGTVNFITREAAEDLLSVDASISLQAFTHNVGDSLPAPQMSLGLSGRSAGFDYSLTGTGRFAEKTYDGGGRELASDAMLGQGGGDRFEEGNLLAKLGYAIDDYRRLSISASLFHLEQEPEYLTTYTPPFARPDFNTPYPAKSLLEDTQSYSARYTDTDFILGDLSLSVFHNDIEKRFDYSEFSFPYNSFVYYSGNPLAPTSIDNQTVLTSERTGVSLSIDTPLDPILSGLKLTWGTDVTWDSTSQTLTNDRDVFTPLKQDGYAGFLQLQLPVGERLVLRGGARYDYLDLTVEDFTRPTVFAAISPTTFFLLPDLNVTGGSFDYDAWTFNIGATYKVADGVEVYGGFNQGFSLPDVGAFTRRAGLGLAFACPVMLPTCANAGQTVSYESLGLEAQIVDNYELGLRINTERFRGTLAGFVTQSDNGVNFDALNNKVEQTKEQTWGIELTAEVDVTDALTLGGIFTYRDGMYDRDKDGDLDYDLPNNRVATPYRGTLYGSYLFEAGTSLHLEGEFWSGRNVFDGTVKAPIQEGAVMNAALAQPLFDGTLSLAVNNVFDTNYQNPTATATRNLPVNAWGRTVVLGYAISF